MFLYVPLILHFKCHESSILNIKSHGTYKNAAVPTTESTTVPTVHTAVPTTNGSGGRIRSWLLLAASGCLWLLLAASGCSLPHSVLRVLLTLTDKRRVRIATPISEFWRGAKTIEKTLVLQTLTLVGPPKDQNTLLSRPCLRTTSATAVWQTISIKILD